MKVVIVNDCSHVMEDLMPYLSERFDIEFITRSRGLWSKTFGLLLKVLRAEGDVFHVNYALQDAYLVDKLKRRLDVLHVHGSDVRWTLHSRKYGWIVKSNLKSAGVVLYATPDLRRIVKKFRSDAIYLPTPVRTDVFARKDHYNDPPRAVYFRRYYEELSKDLIELLEKNGIPLVIVEKKVPYEMMPDFLRKFDIFIDQFTIPSFSKTCLEAMSCGLATIDYRHKNSLSSRITFLSDISNVKRIGDENRKFVIENHDVKKVADMLAGIWNDIK